jgi:hypothetical protein
MTARLKQKPASHANNQDLVKSYKQLLRSILEQRPSGTRQRLAERLGKNRSFVSQFSNPAYKTPIPSRHLDVIFEVCHFSTAQKNDFMQGYRAAHPRRAGQHDANPHPRKLTIEVPDFGEESTNRELDRLIEEFALTATRLLKSASS